MNINIIVMTALLCGFSLAEEKDKKDFVVQDMESSKLDSLLERESKKISDLSEEELIKFIKNNPDEIYGGASDLSDFYTLEEVCNLIKKLKNKVGIEKFLYSEFLKLDPLNEEPKNWAEIAVVGRGGSLGLVTECLLEISGEKMFLRMFNSVLESGKPQKMKALLNVVKIRKEMSLYENMINLRKLEKFEGVFEEFLKGNQD